MDLISQTLLDRLAGLARRADEDIAWPAESWQALCELGGTRWALPRECGGDGLHGADLLERYETLAQACLTTCFVLSQRDAACRRLLGSGKVELCRDLLPSLASGAHFITVGLAQLTTSRQHGKPALTVRTEGDNLILDGQAPWVTGAARAEHVIIGGVQQDGGQLLVAMPTDLPGVRIGPAAELAALQGSLTAAVHCEGVRVPKKWLLAGPAPQVMSGERGGTGGLETSCLALGLARAAVAYVRDEADNRPDLDDDAGRLENGDDKLRQELYRLAAKMPTPGETQTLRARANAFVLRATQVALVASKGTGFVRDHPAQRWARQALFFLVWSCPRPVTDATLAYLSGSSECA